MDAPVLLLWLLAALLITAGFAGLILPAVPGIPLIVTNAGSDTVSVFLGQAAPPSGGPASDFTGDRTSDLLWHHATRGEVWLWPMSGGQHTAESYVSIVNDPAWEIRGLGDQTGDGQADILWRHATTGQLYLWTTNGSAVEAMTYVGTVDVAFDIVGTGDYGGDGRSDILWRHQATGDCGSGR